MKIPSSIRRAARTGNPSTPVRPQKPPVPPRPRGTKARPSGARRALARPRPTTTLYGRTIIADLALAGRNRSDLAGALGCSVSRVHQVLRDRRMDADPGADAVMDDWRDRIRAALDDMTPPVAVVEPEPVAQPPVEPIPSAPAAPEVQP